MTGYTCECCDKYYDELPTSYGYPAPVYYYEAESDEQSERFELSEDLCVMDKEHFFIRGCLEIPITGSDEILVWGVWVSLSESNFLKVNENWEQQEQLEPMFGWLSNELPIYPDTVNLKTKIHFRPDGVRPFIELEPTDHPLAVDFRNGISIEKLKDIASELCNNSEDEK